MMTHLGLDTYFRRTADGSLAGRYASEVNLLSRVDAEALTQRFVGHPMVDALGGLVLDDPETSNHHLLLTIGPVAGQVFYLSHDGDSRVVFATLDAFVDAAQHAVASNLCLSTRHPEVTPPGQDQRALAAFIKQRLPEGNEDLVVAMIPSLDMQDLPLLERLARHADFFVAEAVAVEILKRPASELEPIALLCSSHAHSQAARAGKAALRAIRDGDNGSTP